MQLDSVYELMPTNGRKSFYGKAKVKVYDDGTKVLQSYNTDMMKITPDGKKIRLTDVWSMTSGNHIASFAGINKKEFFNLPTE